MGSPIIVTEQTGPLAIVEDGPYRTVVLPSTTIYNPGDITPDDFIYLNADYTLTSTTSAQKLFNSSTNGRLTLETGIYAFNGLFYLTTMSATSGNAEFGILGAGSAVLSGVMFDAISRDGSTLNSTAGSLTGGFATAAATTGKVATASTGTELATRVQGVFKCTTGGTIVPSISLTTAAAAVVKAGSHLRLRRLSDSGTYVTGSWD